mmetsp:Transcript_57600/g.106465  ORF Transcript_57600/g.106465 Transcript_57600/m.106465 type:complete len:286 (-) Transcript_57600:42-899(-)
MKLQVSLLVFLSLSSLGCAAHASKGAAHKSLRPVEGKLEADDSVVKPLQFHQSLLICNAYPHEEPAIVSKNGKELEMDGDVTEVGYGHCAYAKDHVESSDKLDFLLRGTETQGTFEIGELPQSDSVLLLVLERRDAHTSLVGFQSFAFPIHSEDQGAQLAIIDAFKGNSSKPLLRMEDHITVKQDKAIAKRSEVLSFNHVYSVEPGTYDAFVEVHNKEEAHFLANATKRIAHLGKNANYVIMRMGDATHQQSLLVFPPEQSAGVRPAVTLLSIVLVSLASLMRSL